MNPGNGCHEEREDAMAAYANALAWYYSGTQSYANKAISYMNAWARTIKDHTYSNAPLQTGWSGASWARAAEIIRYSNAGWSSRDITAFENMLSNVYLPKIIGGSNSNGNWELVMMEAAQGISVFLNDASSYDKTMNKIPRRSTRIRLPDQRRCAQVQNYWDQSTFPENGIAQETCRDFAHTGYGIASMSHIAETSKIQGTDLWTTDVGTRIRYALDFHSQFELGAPVSNWLCGGSVDLKNGKRDFEITEVGYNALNGILGIAMTNTGTLTQQNRPGVVNATSSHMIAPPLTSTLLSRLAHVHDSSSRPVDSCSRRSPKRFISFAGKKNKSQGHLTGQCIEKVLAFSIKHTIDKSLKEIQSSTLLPIPSTRSFLHTYQPMSSSHTAMFNTTVFHQINRDFDNNNTRPVISYSRQPQCVPADRQPVQQADILVGMGKALIRKRSYRSLRYPYDPRRPQADVLVGVGEALSQRRGHRTLDYRKDPRPPKVVACYPERFELGLGGEGVLAHKLTFVMEAVGLTASLGQLIEITAKTIKYLNNVKEASKERANLFQEASSLLPLLVSLQAQVSAAKQSEPWFDDIKLLGVENGPLDQLQEALVQLTSKLKPKQGVEKAARAFIWTLDKAYCESVLNKIERVKSRTALALGGGTFKLARAIKADTSGITGRVAAVADDLASIQLDGDLKKRREILDWFSPLNFFKTQQDVFARRQEGTGQWLIDSPTFQTWLSGPERTLCCPGIPGAGKTISASVVVDSLRTQQRKSSSSIGVAAIYCNFKEKEMQTSHNLQAGACAQLIQDSMQPLPGNLTTLHKRHSKSATRPSWEEINQIFESVASSYHTIYVVVDAIDECSEETRIAIIKGMAALPDKVRILITTRPIHEITRLFPSSPKIEIRATDFDLTKFLAAKLLVDNLSNKTSVQKLKKALNDLPSTLNGLYDNALQRVDSQNQDDRELAEKSLRWVAYAYRPLSIPVLRGAVAIDSEQTDYDAEALPAIDLILDVCNGLLIVDEEAKLVRLVHYTAQDYFNALAESKSPGPHAAIAGECLTYLNYVIFQAGLIETVMTSLPQGSYYSSRDAFPSEQDPVPSSESSGTCLSGPNAVSSSHQHASHRASDFSFPDESISAFRLDFEQQDSPDPPDGLQLYASVFWALHAKARLPADQNELGLHINKFLGSNPCVTLDPVDVKDDMNALAFYNIQYNDPNCLESGYRPLGDAASTCFTALQVAAYNNQAMAVEILLDHGADIEYTGSSKETPLIIAIRDGSVSAATVLIHRGANVMAVDESSFGPIELVNQMSPLPFLKFLLNAGAKKDEHVLFRGSPLMQSIIAHDDIETARWLAHDTTLDPAQEPVACSLLFSAVLFGRVELTKLLLEHGADVTKPHLEESYLHILCQSKTANRLQLLNLLIDRGIDVDNCDYYMRTTLHVAVSRGLDDLVLALLQQGANINTRDSAGETPLHMALHLGQTQAALALLQHGADVDIQDNGGLTALHMTSIKGQSKIADELLRQKAPTNTRSGHCVSLTYDESKWRDDGFDNLILDVHCGHAARARSIHPKAFEDDYSFMELKDLFSTKERVLQWRVFPDGMSALDIAVLRRDHDIIRLLKPLSIDQHSYELPKVLPTVAFLHILESIEPSSRNAGETFGRVLGLPIGRWSKPPKIEEPGAISKPSDSEEEERTQEECILPAERDE
ncbi:MAG: hypothetical protein Q9169_004432 [Polycauliona sp. 2 TL-2023]